MIRLHNIVALNPNSTFLHKIVLSNMNERLTNITPKRGCCVIEVIEVYLPKITNKDTTNF